MLIYFKVGNYKSIKEPILLNFNAAAISEHTDSNVIADESLPLLKSILLYGPNASGKSKILDAFVSFKWLINNSATEKQGNEQIDVESFQLSEATENMPCFFEVSFVLDKQKYRYGFEVDKEKIHKEWLLESKVTKEYPVFLRIGEQFEINSKRFPNAEGLEKRTRKNALFLSVASQWNVKKAEQINEWFSQIFTIHGVSDELYKNVTIDLLKDRKYAAEVEGFIQKADLGIQAIELAKASSAVFTIHQKFNETGEITDSVRFLLEGNESEGTKKYFNLIGVFIKAIAEGRIVVIDEFDARLHTLLAKSILKLFNSTKTKSKAQLLAASYDTALLDRDLLRRDQIYFVEKNRFGASKVTSLVEYKPRKESPYDKNYLEGKYGAIPFIDSQESLTGNY